MVKHLTNAIRGTLPENRFSAGGEVGSYTPPQFGDPELNLQFSTNTLGRGTTQDTSKQSTY